MLNKKKALALITAALLTASLMGGCIQIQTEEHIQDSLNSLASEISSQISDVQESLNTESSANDSSAEHSEASVESVLIETDKTEGDFTYDLYSDHAVVTKYSGGDMKVKIPDTLGGQPVKKVERKNYILPISGSPVSIELPETLEEIGDYAFYGCSAKKIYIPDSVTRIGEVAFKDCRNLEDIQLPKKLKEIGKGAFYSCLSKNAWKDGKVVIPEGVTEIPEEAFAYGTMESVSLDDGITIIGSRAFNCCENLKMVNFPSDLSKIGGWAFEGCPIESIVLPEGIEIEREAFSKNDAIKKLVIPKKIRIEPCCFQNCIMLEEVEINSDYVGQLMFANCISLKKVTMSNDVIKIESQAFDAYSNDTCEIHIPESVEVIEKGIVGHRTNQTVIYGKKGSEAEKYANSNGIKFEEE